MSLQKILWWSFHTKENHLVQEEFQRKSFNLNWHSAIYLEGCRWKKENVTDASFTYHCSEENRILSSTYMKILPINQNMSLWNNHILWLQSLLLILLYWKTQAYITKSLKWFIWKIAKQYIFLHFCNFSLHFLLKKIFDKKNHVRFTAT